MILYTSLYKELHFSACFSNTFPASGYRCLPTTTGTDGFIMPAFSPAIFSIVSPRNSVCSRSIVIITLARGRTTFVESSRPPSPVSYTAKSTSAVLKHKNEYTVTSSNHVNCLAPGSSSAGMEETHLYNSSAASSYTLSEKNPSAVPIRSRKSEMCGDI